MYKTVEAVNCVRRSHWVGDVLVATAAGVFNPAAMREMRAYVTGILHERAAKAVVVDLTKTLQAITPDGWDRAVAEAAADSLGPPMALVVPEVNLTSVDDYCERLARLGVLRVAFADLSSGLAWAADRRGPSAAKQAVPRAGS